MPFAADIVGEEYALRFQRDNSLIYTSNMSKQCHTDHSITTLPWPPKSPRVNNFEGVGDIMARTIYVRWKHYAIVCGTINKEEYSS